MLIVADQNSQSNVDVVYREYLGWALLCIVVGTVFINLIKALVVFLITFMAYLNRKCNKNTTKKYVYKEEVKDQADISATRFEE